MISKAQFGSQAMTASKQAMPESTKYDGPSGVSISGVQNKFAANSNAPIANPGFSE